MNYKKITETDLQGVGVIGLADTPELSCEDMQAKFEETAREVIIPAYNRLIDDLTSLGRPVESGDVARMKIGRDGDLLVSRDGHSWLATTSAAMDKKADKSDTYTKAQTDEAISRRVKIIGAADMTKADYDKNGDGVVDRAETSATADNATKFGDQLPAYYRKAPVIYTATLFEANWTGSGPYTQTVNVPGILATDNPVVDVRLATTVYNGRLALENFSHISKIETEDGKITATCFNEKPQAMMTVRLLTMR